jgi:hypothetical protein
MSTVAGRSAKHIGETPQGISIAVELAIADLRAGNTAT